MFSQISDLDYQEALVLAEQDVDFDEMEQDIEQFAQDPSVREVLSVGVDLQNYGSEIARQLKIAENESIESNLKQISTVHELHHDIEQTDKDLQIIEDSLSQFKDSLGQLSSNICTLQTRSQAITIKLTNRKNLEQYLGQYARDISLSRDFINQICNGVIGPRYAIYLQQLNRKLEIVKNFTNAKLMKASSTNVNQKVQSGRTSSQNTFHPTLYAAANEVRAPLDCLRLKASENVVKWLISRIDHLRDYYGTDQIAVQSDLIKSKYLYSFLKRNSPDIEIKIKEYYTQIMSRIYLENFKMIGRMVYKRMNPISTSNEILVPIIQKQSFFSRKTSITDSTAFFELGETRHRLIHDILSPPQSFGDVHYPVEALVRSMYQTLIDTITMETTFANNFFEDANIGMSIFSATSRFMESFISELFGKINDPISLLLFYRFAIAHHKEMNNRKISLLDAHFNSIQQKIESRFKSLMTINRNAIENCDISIFLGSNSTSPHLANTLTKRFAQFALSLALITNEETDDLTRQDTQMLSQSTIKLLEKIGKQLSSNSNSNEIELIFLINNYFHIVSTLRESLAISDSSKSQLTIPVSPGRSIPQKQSRIVQPPKPVMSRSMSNIEKMDSSGNPLQTMHSKSDVFIDSNLNIILPIFEQYLNDTSLNYIENLLKAHFTSLVNIVHDAFEKVDNDKPRKVTFNLSELEEIANDFKSKYNQRLKNIIDSQLPNFGDYLNGKEIMKQIAKRLVVYWAKFHQLATIILANGKMPQWMSTIPTVPILVNEVQSITEKL